MDLIDVLDMKRAEEERVLRKQVFPLLMDNGYQVLKALGSGSFGNVVACKNSHGKQVAIKIVAGHNSNYEELAYWKRLNHRNVLPLLDFMRLKDFYLFVMPLHEKSLIDCVMDENFPKDRKGFELTSNWLRQILKGLKYLHKHNFCHMDLKSDNVLVTSNLNAVICDFSFINTTVSPVEKYGLPHCFLPPETTSGVPLRYLPVDGVQFDIWSFGYLALNIWALEWFEKTFVNLGNDWNADVYPRLFRALQMPVFEDLITSTYPDAGLNDQDVRQALNLLKATLRFKPQDRPNISSLLRHPTMSKKQHPLLEPDEIWIIDQNMKNSVPFNDVECNQRVHEELYKKYFENQVENSLPYTFYYEKHSDNNCCFNN